MKKMNISKSIVLACIVLLGVFMFNPLETKAATPKVEEIPREEEVTKYDITGDGKVDTIKIGYDESEEGGRVWVNDSVALKFIAKDKYGDFEAKIIILKNGKKFLYLFDDEELGVGNDYVYKYQDGKYVKVGDLHPTNKNTDYGGQWYRTNKIKVSGNTISVYGYFNFYLLGGSIVKFNYVYKDGKLKKSPTSGWIKEVIHDKGDKLSTSRTMVSKRKLVVYKTAIGSKKKMVVKKGKKVTVDRVYYSTKTGMSVRVKYNKKYGWIKCKKNDEKEYFKYIFDLE